MKFNEHLSSHLTPEWRTQYINYAVLKEFLYKCLQDEPLSAEKLEQKTRYYEECDINFFPLCAQELKKINNFFSEKLAEATRKFGNLDQELKAYQIQLARKQRMKKVQVLGSKNVQEIFIESNDEMNVKKRPVFNPQRRQSIITTWMSEKKYKTLHDLKLGFSEFYLSLILLQNFQSLNFTGFRKILKKHDKLFGLSTGTLWRLENVDKSIFHLNSEVDDLIVQVENTYTKELESGDRQKAMKRLRVPPLTEEQNSWTTFRLGFFIGIFLVQVVVIGVTIILSYDKLPSVCGPANRIFRSTFLVISFMFLIGVNVYFWRSAGVNHVLIFEIDPRNHLTPTQLMEKSCRLLVIWGLCVIYFLYSPRLNTPAYVGPFFIVSFLVVYLLNPLPILNNKSRFWFREVLIKIMLAPFYSVHFADFWLADQLNSLSFVFVDIGYFICFFGFNIEWNNGFRTSADVHSDTNDYIVYTALKNNATRVTMIDNNVCNNLWYGLNPLLRALPAWFRFAQCLRRYHDNYSKTKRFFPHVVNAGKYLSTIVVVIISAIYSLNTDSKLEMSLLLIACIVNSVYACSWDLLMDWGLFDRNAQEDKILRDELVYRFRVYYYLAIVENLLGRLAWVVLILLHKIRPKYREIIIFLVLLTEVIRRFVWNFFRLENEHLNNCGEFRAVRDIFIAPIKAYSSNDVPVRPKKPALSATEKYPINNDSDTEDITNNHSSPRKSFADLLFRPTKINIQNFKSFKKKSKTQKDHLEDDLMAKDPALVV